MRAVYARLHFRMHVVDLHGDRVNSYDLASFELVMIPAPPHTPPPGHVNHVPSQASKPRRPQVLGA